MSAEFEQISTASCAIQTPRRSEGVPAKCAAPNGLLNRRAVETRLLHDVYTTGWSPGSLAYKFAAWYRKAEQLTRNATVQQLNFNVLFTARRGFKVAMHYKQCSLNTIIKVDENFSQSKLNSFPRRVNLKAAEYLRVCDLHFENQVETIFRNQFFIQVRNLFEFKVSWSSWYWVAF